MLNNNPYFGLIITLAGYYLGSILNKKFKSAILNPMLIGVLVSCLFIEFSGVTYDDYMVGGNYLVFFVTPATISLVVSLYKNIEILKKNLLPILVGVIGGSFTSVISVLLLAKLFNLNVAFTSSLVPQSITTAIAMPMSEAYGGIPAITAVIVSFRGIYGAIVSPSIFKLFNIKDPVAKGIALGTSSHAIGTSKAIELGEVEGAMSGLSIAISGIVTVFIIPLIYKIISF